MRFFVLYGIIPDKGYCNFVRVSEIKGVQNLSNTTTPWVCAFFAHTQGVDTMLIVLKHAEGMSQRYDVIFTRHMLSPSTLLGRRVGLGLEPKGLDFAADGDDVAGGDGAHDEHCHHD